MENLIDVKNLNKSFGKKVITSNLNFEIEKNKVTALVGVNGIGKTVLVEVLATIRKLDSGNIKYNFDYVKSPKEKIGIQFQNEDIKNDFLIPSDLFSFYFDLYGKSEEIELLIDKMDFRQYLSTPIKKLSGGQKKKMNILLALSQDPELLILDEFSSSLDIDSREDIVDFLNEIKNNKTIIMVTHDDYEIKKLSDNILHFKSSDEMNSFKTLDILNEYNDDVMKFLLEILRGEKNA